MRRTSLLTGLGATLLASPAFAHHGDQPSHWLVQHGFGVAIAALAVIAGAAFIAMKRKG